LESRAERMGRKPLSTLAQGETKLGHTAWARGAILQGERAAVGLGDLAAHHQSDS